MTEVLEGGVSYAYHPYPFMLIVRRYLVVHKLTLYLLDPVALLTFPYVNHAASRRFRIMAVAMSNAHADIISSLIDAPLYVCTNDIIARPAYKSRSITG
jgi:hypothetical protein